MDVNVITIFLSLALTIAFTRMWDLSPIPITTWMIFFYFCFRRCCCYLAEVRLVTLEPHLLKTDMLFERFAAFAFGIDALFLFVVTGYNVTKPDHFFLWSSLALLVNIIWLIVVLLLVDKANDTNPKLTVREMLRNCLILKGLEAVICLFGGTWLYCKWEWDGMDFSTIQPWVFLLSLGLLVFIIIVEAILHKAFLFDSTYKIK